MAAPHGADAHAATGTDVDLAKGNVSSHNLHVGYASNMICEATRSYIGQPVFVHSHGPLPEYTNYHITHC